MNIETNKYLRAKELCSLFRISIPTLYRYAKDQTFPKPIKPSSKVTLWNVEEIEEYFKSKS